ncbi:MAG: copper amine oxidase N-terminal domain-containing protein [Oscillospiraceae bacterium]|nr:copper amine oxidase N-terminal domain-containing protein [Oscillospiraceae bacterium]
MKALKLFIAAAAAAGISAAFAVNAYAEADIITVKVDNETVEFDQNPVIVDPGYTMVPIRAVFEKAGAVVDWDQETQTASISKGDYTVTIKYGDSAMYKNGERIELDSPAIIENNRTLIPVRAIAEAMDYAVTWDGHHSMVLVSTTGKPYRPYAFLKLGFRTLEDASELYLKGTGVSGSADLDGDGVPENITFSTADESTLNSTQVFTVNGIDYTAGLGSVTSAYSIAVVDLCETDGTKEIVMTENGDVLTAHFYHYNSGILTPITDGSYPATITYAQQLLISGKGTETNQRNNIDCGYMLSDLTGTCFTDIMVTGGIYMYSEENGSYVVSLNNMKDISTIYGRNLYKTYNDKMLYNIIYTGSYTPGGYREVEGGTIDESALEHFIILDGYIDPEDKRYIELYLQLDDGSTAVIKPYAA